MNRNVLKYAMAMAAAAIIGFVLVQFGMGQSLLARFGQTELELKIYLRGERNVPVPNARLSLFAPDEKPLGFTRKDGNFEGTIRVPKGQMIILQAQGPTFRIRKELAIPRVSSYKLQVFLDPKEARLGNMSLITRSLDDFNRKMSQTYHGRAQATARKAKPKAAAASPAQGPANPVKVSASVAASVSAPVSAPVSALTLASATTSAPTSARRTMTSSASGIAVDFQPVSPRIDQVLRGQQTLARAAVQGSEISAALRVQGVKKLRLRLASLEGSYVELIAVGRTGRTLASYLLRGDRAAVSTYKGAMIRMTRPATAHQMHAPAPSGRLVLQATEGKDVRAYLNGIRLRGKAAGDTLSFEFASAQLNVKKKGVVVVTSDGGPFIRSILSADALNRDVRWNLPMTRLSRR